MKAKFDIDGNLILNKQRYKDYFNRKETIGKEQRYDGGLIQMHQNVIYYEPEYRDYIENFLDVADKETSNVYKSQQVFWDHVVVTKQNNVVIFETDDASHSDFEFCKKRKFLTTKEEFEKRQHIDKIKDKWASEKGVDLVRLPYDITLEEKIKIIKEALDNK